jgi:hypothetical protein
MSLEIQDEFASSYARYSYDKDNWQIQPQQIAHVFMDWFDKWLVEHESEKLSKEYTHSPHSESVVKEMFGKFFNSIKKRNHVHIPKAIQEAAIIEYLED